MEDKDSQYLWLTSLPLSSVDCPEIWEPQTPGTFWACTGISLRATVKYYINFCIMSLSRTHRCDSIWNLSHYFEFRSHYFDMRSSSKAALCTFITLNSVAHCHVVPKLMHLDVIGKNFKYGAAWHKKVSVHFWTEYKLRNFTITIRVMSLVFDTRDRYKVFR